MKRWILKMGKRKILSILVTITIVVGTTLIAVPFISSMNPSIKAKERAKISVAISSIPKIGALEIDFHGNKAFLLRNTQITAYWFPFWDGAYRLPDPTWERAVVPCASIETNKNGIFCSDKKLPKSWREIAQWDLGGKSTSKSMPDLKTIPFRVQDKSIVFSPEYR
jgi:Rieske Fe-S protein